MICTTPEARADIGARCVDTCACCSTGTRVWVGNGMGQIEALDLRAAPSKIAMGHALKGSAGSVGAHVSSYTGSYLSLNYWCTRIYVY